MREYESILKNSESIARLAKEQGIFESYYREISDRDFDKLFMQWFVYDIKTVSDQADKTLSASLEEDKERFLEDIKNQN